MGSHVVEVGSPFQDLFQDLLLRVEDVYEPLLVKAFIPQLSVEGFDDGVLHRLTGIDEVDEVHGPNSVWLHRLRDLLSGATTPPFLLLPDL